jgi:Undecaprenyl-phosphate glucose phosphotransferase
MIRKNERFLTQIYTFVDLLVMQVVFLFSWWLKFHSGLIDYEEPLPIQTYFQWALVYATIAVLVGYFVALYSPKRKKTFSYEALKIIQIHLISFLGLLSVLFALKEVDISRAFLLIFLANNIVFIGLYRYSVKVGLKHFREKGYNKHSNVLNHPELGYEVVGFLDDNSEEQVIKLKNESKRILGEIDELESILSSIVVDEVIIALPLNAHAKYGKLINICEKVGVKVMIIPDFYDYLPAQPRFDNFAGMPLINVRDIPLDDFRNRVVKRAFDLLFALTAILITSPLLLLIAIGVKLSSSGPIIFKQERVGLNRRNFMMYKFRSMKVQTDDTSDTQWTTADDPRKTRFGTFIRKTSLDELPQFFNVLLGHMSVVGPRPERPFYVEQFKEEIPKYMVKHHIRPGITGLAQAKGLRGDTSIEDRIRHDIFYIENWSFIFDIKIICKTIFNGFINKNAY